MDLGTYGYIIGGNFVVNLAIMDLIHWSVRSSSRKGGNGVKGMNGRDRYFRQLQISLY